MLIRRNIPRAPEGDQGGGEPAPAAAAPVPAPEAPAPGLTTTPAPAIEVPDQPAAKTLGATLYGGAKEGAPADGLPPTQQADPAAPAGEGGDAPAAPKEGEGEPAPAPAPLTVDSYADLTLPEGMEVDDALFTRAKEVFAESGIAPDKAPALLSVYKTALEAQAESTRAAIVEQDAKWRAELEALPEFAGERMTSARNLIGRAIEEFGTPELRTTLETYGLGNNPAIGRMIYNMALALSEGTLPQQGTQVANDRNGRRAGGRTLGEKLYGSTQ